MRRAAAVLLAAVALAPRGAAGYPLDGYEDTGIARLEAYRLVQDGAMMGRILPWGAQLYAKELGLRLPGKRVEIPPPDPEFTARVVELLGEDARHYGLAILDVSDPKRPRYAAHNASEPQNPGSVGKILVALAFFQTLADTWPELDDRQRVLRETVVTADEFIRSDTHVVPFWKPGEPAYIKREIQEGDRANLYTWFDWMLSSSSNAAAAIVQKQLVLLARFGTYYPVSRDEEARFFAETPKAELTRLFTSAMQRASIRAGLDPGKLRQGSLFTREGKARIPGTTSIATPEELLRYMLFLEEGRLVDEWSSFEIKKLLYLTDRRVRYAASPDLFDWAVYFKSGSLYSCQPEPGFECGKYRGNKSNYMNSVAMVENVDQGQRIQYMAVVLSNVLRKNSAFEHKALGARVHELIRSFHAPSEAAAAEAD